MHARARRARVKISTYFWAAYAYTGCLKKNATEIKQAVVYHKRG
jgi:hypothetical protein